MDDLSWTVQIQRIRDEYEALIEAQAAEIARLQVALEHVASALNRVAWGGDFTCFVDAEWVSVNNALDAARAALGDAE